MIVQISGNLDALETGAAIVTPGGGLTYQVLLSAYTAAKLAGNIGEQIKLHTLEFYESQGQGSTMLPRMAGFLNMQDKAFYELFITCKGIGYRKALRAMTLNSSTIASAIADRDTATLQSLPEIGKRTAETIIVNLKEKVDRFTIPESSANTKTSDDSNSAGGKESSGTSKGSIAREALNALLQLGENRAQATIWIDKALSENQDQPPATAQELLAKVYQIRES